MNKIKLYLVSSFLLLVFLLCISCEKFFDINNGEIALEENVYQETSEVYAGFLV
ncbi:MAG: hypothetical protein LIO65_08230 [Odoribacter sp.]|nr:hypothetical protein [Odoribacter sp.]